MELKKTMNRAHDFVLDAVTGAVEYVDVKSTAVGAALLGSSWAVLAQGVTDPFDTALATATTKVGAYAAALVGLAAVGVVFMIAIKYVKRIPRAS